MLEIARTNWPGTHTAAVTSIQGQGDVLSYADGNTTLEGTRITSATGRVTVIAGKDLDILPAVNSSFVEDVHQSWSLFSFSRPAPALLDPTGGVSVNHKVKDTTQTTDITLTGSHIQGDSVLLQAGGDAQVVAASVSGTHGARIVAAGTVTVEAGEEIHASLHDHQESRFGATINTMNGRYHGTVIGTVHLTGGENGTTVTPVMSHIDSALGTVTIAGSQGTTVRGTDISAAGDILLGNGAQITAGGSLAQSSSGAHAGTRTTALKINDGFEDSAQTSTVVPSTFTTGGKVIFTAGEGGVTLGAVEIHSGGTTDFRSPEVRFVGEKGSDFASHSRWDKDRGYEMMEGSGHAQETLTLAHIDAGGGIVLPTGTRVSVQLDAGAQPLTANELQALARQTGELPGMAWLKDLAERPDVDWQAIQTVHQTWDYHHQGLTPTGALVLTAVVSCFAGPAIGEALSTVAQGAAAATITEGLVAGTITTVGEAVAIQASYAAFATAGTAGLTSLANKAAISFANNGGNLSATLHDLGSSRTVKQVLASMISGGVDGYFSGTYSLESLVGKTIAGCAASELSGGRCQDGAATAFAIGGLSWAAHQFRQNTIANSSQFKGICLGDTDQCENNLTKPSVGVNGDNLGMGGGRWDVVRICSTDGFSCTVDPDGLVRVTGYGVENLTNTLPSEALENVFQRHGSSLLSPMGGLQGSGGYLKIFGIGPGFYAKGSFWDKWVVEPFSGAHDQFNSSSTYDTVNDPAFQAQTVDFQGNPIDGQSLAPRFVGNIQPMTSAEKWLSATMNVIDIPLATPFALATIS